MKFPDFLGHFDHDNYPLGDIKFDLKKDERWRYTDLKALTAQKFRPVMKRTLLDEAQLKPFFLDGFSRIVFINGLYSNQHTSVTDSLKFKMGIDDEVSFDQSNPFASATRVISGPNGIDLTVIGGQHKLQIIHYNTSIEEYAVLPLIKVAVTGGGELTLVEQFIAGDASSYFNNAVLDLDIGDNSEINYYRLSQESKNAIHLGAIEVNICRDGRFNGFECSFGAAVQRSALTVLLNGENSESNLYGLYPLKDKRHADFYTVISHEKPHTRSKQLYKGVLSGSARGMFDGSIIVKQDAQQINADQLNQNLLLTDTAKIFSKPQLEIAANDVKCTHGATSGQVDPMELFYLQTRGIPREKGLMMLAKAFADQIIFSVKEPQVQKLMIETLDKEFWEKRG